MEAGDEQLHALDARYQGLRVGRGGKPSSKEEQGGV